LPRYRLTIEYDGSPYAGWQCQMGQPSVQAAIERAIAKFCGEVARLTTAGRTDAGVHATAQTAHVDLTKDWSVKTVRAALNAHLRQDGEAIAILGVEQVGAAFNARFSAIKRHYRYFILNRHAPPALESKRVWWQPRRLDANKMHQAAQTLVGFHDFTTFRASACQAKSPHRTLGRLDVVAEGDKIIIEASARSFLHHQVRSMVGSLVEVGLGRWQIADIQSALAARDHARCGRVAPAQGLYLVGVDYPDEAFYTMTV